MVQFEPQKESTKKPDKSWSIYAIPQNLQNIALSAQNIAKTYDKPDSYFDKLEPMTNKDEQYESIQYNEKNCETFDL